MKIIYFTLICTHLLLSASTEEIGLYEKIVSKLFHNRDKIVVYTDDSLRYRFSESNVLTVTNDCKKAHIQIGDNFFTSRVRCKNKPIFTTNYRSYKYSPNSIGVFYWRKGRPQIRFRKSTLKKFHIDLPHKFKKYLES